MPKKADLQKEIDHLNEQLAKSGRTRQKRSTYFITVNSNETTRNKTERESSKAYMREIMKYAGDNAGEYIQFNEPGHEFTKKFVDDVNFRFSLEVSKGRKKKDGSYSDYAGQVHAHAILDVKHKSNISINHDKLRGLLQPLFNEYYGHDGYIGPATWIPQHKLEEYLTKGKEYDGGFKWVEV